jgi:hypothetical protein
MSEITEEIVEKAGDAFTQSWMTRVDPSDHWQHADMRAALNAVLPDILEEAASKVRKTSGRKPDVMKCNSGGISPTGNSPRSPRPRRGHGNGTGEGAMRSLPSVIAAAIEDGLMTGAPVDLLRTRS